MAKGDGQQDGRPAGHSLQVRQGYPHSLYTKALPCFLVANQLVTMHDLKQGLGPSGTDGPRKLTYNKYKLKVSALRLQWEVKFGNEVSLQGWVLVTLGRNYD